MKDIIKVVYGEETPYISCLDHGFVKLVDCMPRCLEDNEDTADYAIAEAARCSYQRGTKTIADDKGLIRYLMRHNHSSPFEMVEFKFHCKMPMFVARQWIRHRTANVNELSGRYSEMPDEKYYPEHDDYRSQSMTNTQGSDGCIDPDDVEKIRQNLTFSYFQSESAYQHMLSKGLCREQARIVLPLSTYTEWYWKIDLKNLLHFLDLRCDHHAQKEIQVYGDAVLDLISPIVPWTIEAWEDYSSYRGGMVLTKHEVEALQKSFSGFKAMDMYIPDINIENKLEKREWSEKLKSIGLESFLDE